MRSKVRSTRSLRATAAGGHSVLPADYSDCRGMRQAYLPLFIYSLRYDNWVIVDGILNFIDVSLCLPRTRVADGTVSNIARGTRFVQISRLNSCHSCETN